ncbi:MAG: helix-turn-helix domain-containing protein [Prosthecobacter sp.]|nr:helix-turn-helix domain-containing protein [Prosthecobacter sp.]
MAHQKGHEQKPAATPSKGDFDAQGFGEAAAALAGAGAASGRGLAEVQVQRLIAWAKAAKRLIAETDFERLPLVSDETGEHEVRFHEPDRRVWKKTWPGTFDPPTDLAHRRSKLGVSQPLFARLLGISEKTLQNWEQGRRKPSGPAKVLLKVTALHPKLLLETVK